MELYTLGSNFRRTDMVDEFVSAIWTERYSVAGDVVLVTDPTPENMLKLTEGTFLSLVGSDEVMILETQVVEDGLLKVSGSSLLDFLRHRIIRYSSTHSVRSLNITNEPPGHIMAILVLQLCIQGLYPLPATEAAGSDIPNLSLGVWDTTGPNIDVSIPYGPLYDQLKTLAETYEVGQSLYLEFALEGSYSLKYKTYKGRDLTSEQNILPMVRFSSVLDSLSDPKELRSISGYKTHCWAYAPDVAAHIAAAAGSVLEYVPGTAAYTGFNRRVMQIFVDDIDSAALEALDPTVAMNLLISILSARARDALANNNHTRVVDGEVVPQNEYKFGQHYLLGDIVELQGHSDIIQKARITEYIRSQDATGEHAYPTVSVID